MNSPIRSFRDLDAWDAAMALAVSCYRLAKSLPLEERFADVSRQLVRTTQLVHGLARSIRMRRLKKIQAVGAVVVLVVISLL